MFKGDGRRLGVGGVDLLEVVKRIFVFTIMGIMRNYDNLLCNDGGINFGWLLLV